MTLTHDRALSLLTSHISIGYESNADIEPEPESFLSLWLKAAR